MEFDQAYIFKYSKRRDTPAADLAGQVPQAMKEERNERLLQLVNEIARCRYETLVGRKAQILVEGPSRKNPLRLMGRTRCNRIVVFDGPRPLAGQILPVTIYDCTAHTLIGGLARDQQPPVVIELNRLLPKVPR